MLATASDSIDELLREAVTKHNEADLRQQYSAQDEFVVVNDFLPAGILEQWESHLPLWCLTTRIAARSTPTPRKAITWVFIASWSRP
jgi:hypothetical protein